MRWLGIGVVFLSACGTAPVLRAPYEVGSMGGVLFSNSPMALHQARPSKASGGLELTYSVLFQNVGQEPAQLGVGEATALLNGEPDTVRVTCAQRGFLPSQALELAPGERLRVDCRLSLTPQGLAVARVGDSELELAFPLVTAGRIASPRFVYRLMLEDLS